MIRIPYLQLRHSCIIAYSQPEKKIKRSSTKKPFVTKSGDVVKTYSGTITTGAKKRLSKAVTLLIQSSKQRYVYNPWLNRKMKFHLNFITLTISSTESLLTANEAHKQLLEPFLLHARRKWKMSKYVWKAELQERGQIHYHITTDVYIDLSALRNKWNELQRNAGLLTEFEKKYGHSNPNSTDIHSVKKIKNIESYLIKYISKSSQNEVATTGKIWDCSMSLKKSKYYTTVCSSYNESLINEAIKKRTVTAIYRDNCTIFTIQPGSCVRYLSVSDQMSFDNHMLSINSG